MKVKDVDIIMVPGFTGSGPLHWQTRWQEKLSSARRVEQRDWDDPEREPWAWALADLVNSCDKPVILIAHSLGVPTVINALPLMNAQPVGAFLVAPPDLGNAEMLTPQMLGFGPYPRERLPFPSIMVGSRNDPYCDVQTAEDLATTWGALYLDAGEAELKLYQVQGITGGTDAQAEVSVRLADEDGKLVTGRAADPDTMVASAKAYIGALNKLQRPGVAAGERVHAHHGAA